MYRELKVHMHMHNTCFWNHILRPLNWVRLPTSVDLYYSVYFDWFRNQTQKFGAQFQSINYQYLIKLGWLSMKFDVKFVWTISFSIYTPKQK